MELFIIVLLVLVAFVLVRFGSDRNRALSMYEEVVIANKDWDRYAWDLFNVAVKLIERIPGAYINGQYVEWQGIRFFPATRSISIEIVMGHAASRRTKWIEVKPERLLRILPNIKDAQSDDPGSGSPTTEALQPVEDGRLKALLAAVALGYSVKASSRKNGIVVVTPAGQEIAMVDAVGIWQRDSYGQADTVSIDEFVAEIGKMRRYVITAPTKAAIPAHVASSEEPSLD